jgi:hypothetical protein
MNGSLAGVKSPGSEIYHSPPSSQVVKNAWGDTSTCLYVRIVTYKGLALLITIGSRFDDWIYWHLFTITDNHNDHTLNSF